MFPAIVFALNHHSRAENGRRIIRVRICPGIRTITRVAKTTVIARRAEGGRPPQRAKTNMRLLRLRIALNLSTHRIRFSRREVNSGNSALRKIRYMGNSD